MTVMHAASALLVAGVVGLAAAALTALACRRASQRVVDDLTRAHEAELRAVALRALTDELTGLPNRVLLLDRLRHALRAQSRRPGSVGLLFLDLDGFKAVNDGYGHAVGDAVLAVTGARLQAAVRSGDTAARLSGDEFVVVCEGLDGASSLAVAAARLEAALTAPIDLDGRRVCLGVSVGRVLAGDGSTAEDLLRDADARMYDVKRDRQLRLAEMGVLNRVAASFAPPAPLRLL